VVQNAHMADQMTGPNACPWCSAALPDPAVVRCPSCGAALTAAPDAPSEIKGVTTLDPEAILRARSDTTRPRNRFLSFITGEVPVDTSGEVSPDSLARPPDEVRREMLRLQIEAERADLTAETVALKADELARRGIHISQLGGPEADPESAPEGAAAGEAAHGSAPAAEATPEAGDGAAPPAHAEGSWPAELTPDQPEPDPTV
jgi:hypothetical protein